MKLKVQDLEIEVRSDLKDYGPQDDGTPFIGEEYYVVAITKRGDVWQHNVRLHTTEREVIDGEPYFADLRDSAKACIENLANKIKQAEEIDLAYWTQGRPVYGSEAYVEYGQYDDLALEYNERFE